MDNQTEQAYSLQIKQFLQSEAWRNYALPLIQQAVSKELPKPDTENWQERYRYAFALSNAFTMVINSLENLSNKAEFLKRVEEYMTDGKLTDGIS